MQDANAIREQACIVIHPLIIMCTTCFYVCICVRVYVSWADLCYLLTLKSAKVNSYFVIFRSPNVTMRVPIELIREFKDAAVRKRVLSFTKAWRVSMLAKYIAASQYHRAVMVD